MTDTPRFVIDGTEYAIPGIDSFTIDECGIFHEWTHVHIEEIEATPVNSMMIAAFMQIAYMRGNPGMAPGIARKMIGQSNLVEAMGVFALDQEEDARPPELPKSEPEPSGSPPNSESSPSISGVGSTTRSATQENGQTSGGTQPSGIHVTSGQLRSVG